MSIDEQIKALQRRKAKIQMLEEVKNFAAKLTNFEYPGLAEEVKQTVERFIDAVSAKVETGELGGSAGGHLPSAEVQVLNGLTNQSGSAGNSAPAVTRPPVSEDLRALRREKAEFAKRYIHLGKKVVTVTLPGKDPIRAVVVSMDAPNIFVQTQEGLELSVTPDQIEGANPQP